LSPTFITERKGKFHLEVTENKVVIFFRPSSRIPLNLSMDPRLRTAGIDVMSLTSEG